MMLVRLGVHFSQWHHIDLYFTNNLKQCTVFSKLDLVKGYHQVPMNSEDICKTAGKDLQAQKATYPSLWGIEESRQQAQQLIDSAIGELSGYDEAAEPLRAIAEYIVNRKN